LPFALTDEQSALSATVGEFLRARYSPTSPTGARDQVWAELWELDVPAMALSEPDGGLGLGAVELVAISEAGGGVPAPIPLLSTAAIFVPMAAAATKGGGRDELLRSLIEKRGTATAVVPADQSDWALLSGDRLSLPRSIVAEVTFSV
jgi:alkylation response protein AidB-like acyl-CoA dehydrogenase